MNGYELTSMSNAKEMLVAAGTDLVPMVADLFQELL